MTLAAPAGMRDLVPPFAQRRRHLEVAITDAFARYGYELVTTPPFEHAEVLERGLETIDRRELLRFVDSDTGEVSLLRPDITPQVARIVATQLRDRPAPYRLAYEGQVIRRRRGRARRQRQIAQAGIECIGLRGSLADAEVIEVASKTLAELGLSTHRIELGLVPVARDALHQLPHDLHAEAGEALLRKDTAGLENLARRAGLAQPRTLLELTHLWGDRSVLDEARRVLTGERDLRRLDTLSELCTHLEGRGLGERVIFDLGEIRGFGYYTGPSFTLLAEGPGEPIGAGGRYDDLLARFGAPLPATGLGIDLDHLEWALGAAGIWLTEPGPPRVVVYGSGARDALADALRAARFRVATLPEPAEGEALEYARAWGYDAIARVEGSTAGLAADLLRVADSARSSWTSMAADGAAVHRWARALREGNPGK